MVSGMRSSVELETKRQRQMIREFRGARYPRRLAYEIRPSDLFQDLEIMDDLHEVRPKEDLVEDVPKKLIGSGVFVVIGARRPWRSVSQQTPHRVVEETIRASLNDPF